MRRISFALITGVVAFLICRSVTVAQVQFESKQLGGRTEVQEPFYSKQTEIGALLDGATRFDSKAHAETVDIATKYYVWRITWLNVQSDIKPPPAVTEMERVRREFREYLIERMVRAEKNNDEAKAAFSKALTTRFQEVFALPFEQNRLAHVNAAMLLPELARTRQEIVGTYLTEMVKNPKTHDLHRLFALKGLGEFFPAREFTILDEGKKSFEEQKSRDLDRIGLLTKIIEHNWNFPADADPSEVEAVRYVRREAIKSLGRVGAPAVEVSKGKIYGPAAYTLFRVLADDGLNPSATLTDKIEAALGVCQLKPERTSPYDAEVGIYLVAKCLAEFASAYQKDFANFKVAKDTRPVLPWKFHAERFKIALQTQYNNLANAGSKRKDRAQELANVATPMLADMKQHNQLNGQDERLSATAERFRPETTVVFKNLPPLTLKIE